MVVLDGDQKPLLQHSLARVLRKVEKVEAGVSDGKEGITAIRRLNVDLYPFHAEDRDPVSPCQKNYKNAS